MIYNAESIKILLIIVINQQICIIYIYFIKIFKNVVYSSKIKCRFV